jgi:hypothetical protein
MAIPVRNKLVADLLAYLQKQPESDIEALTLYEALLEDQTQADYEDLKAEDKLPKPTKGGAYII